MSEMMTIVEGRPVLRIERRLGHPVEKVWRAVTEPGHLSRWYPFTITALDLRVGGKITFDDEAGTVAEGRVTDLVPQRVFAFAQTDEMTGHNTVHIELRPDGARCVMVFTHSCDDLPGAASFTAGWTFCLDDLRALLAGRPAEPPKDFVDRHERYIKQFGLDEGTAEAVPGGWRVRLVRQLMMQPIDKVWPALTGPDEPKPGGPVPPALVAAGIAPGAVTEVRAPNLLAYDLGAGTVRWELSEGPGGARITLTQDIPAGTPDSRDRALAAWRTHIENLAARLRGTL